MLKPFNTVRKPTENCPVENLRVNDSRQYAAVLRRPVNIPKSTLIEDRGFSVLGALFHGFIQIIAVFSGKTRFIKYESLLNVSGTLELRKT